MLFQEHKDQYIKNEGEVLYYSGATAVMLKTIAFVVGVKQADGNIRATVTYHRPRQMPEIKKEEVLSPAGFEKLLHHINKTMEERYNGKGTLKDVRYRSRALDENLTVHLDEDELEELHQDYIFQMISGASRTEAYDKIMVVVKNKIKERI